MGDQMPIRRCTECGYKTHHRYWKDDKICPVCERVAGHVESNHGGLSEAGIIEARNLVISLKSNTEGGSVLTNPSPERHY